MLPAVIKLVPWVAAIACVACGKKSKSEPPPEAGVPAPTRVEQELPPPDAPPRKPVQPWAGPGSCKLEVTGKEALQQDDGRASMSASWWFTEADHPTDLEPESFTLNCSGHQVQLTFGARRGTAEFGPRTYVVAKDKAEISIQGAVNRQPLESPTGTLAVTTFDNHQLTAKIDVSGTSGKARLRIRGTIDYKCPGYSGCEESPAAPAPSPSR